MLRSAPNISWQRFVPNKNLYRSLPRITDKAAWRRLGLIGHYFWCIDLPAGEVLLREPTLGYRKLGRPPLTFVDLLERDACAANIYELATCMTKREDLSARRETGLRLPWANELVTQCVTCNHSTIYLNGE